MVRDAEKFAEEDKKRRAAAEAKNNAESLIHTTERQLAENGDKVDDGAQVRDRGGDRRRQGRGRERRCRRDDSRRRRRSPQVAMKLGQAIYEKQQQSEASPQASSAAGSEAGGEDVVDAEFSEVDDNKA